MTTLSLKALSLGITDHHKDRLVRFGLVGASGVLVNSTLLYLLTEVGGLNHLVAAVLATEITIFYNFSLNDRWAFGDVKPSIWWVRRVLRYNSIALVGLVISVAVLAVLTYLLSLNYLVANLFAIGAATFWNYAANSCFTWPTVAVPSFTKALALRRARRQVYKGRADEASPKRACSPIAAPAGCRSRFNSRTLYRATETARKKIFSGRSQRTQRCGSVRS
jgi:putative flippase GtrA